MMKIDKNDARLTSYALGELRAKEKEELEKILETKADLMEDLTKIKSFCQMLGEGLKSEPAPELSHQRVNELKRVFSKGKTKTRTFLYFSLALVPVAAAVLTFVFTRKHLNLEDTYLDQDKVVRFTQENNAYTASDRTNIDRIRSHSANSPMLNIADKQGANISEFEFPPVDSRNLDYLADNPFRSVFQEPLSTFSVQVSLGSYDNIERFVDQGKLPPRDMVRIEGMLNHFSYNYAPPAPESEHPFSVHFEMSLAPWDPTHKLVMIGLKGQETNDPSAIIAEEVKAQVEFNPEEVIAYRLLGYENAAIPARDLNDSNKAKTAEKFKSGQEITVLYELIPKGAAPDYQRQGDLRYQKSGDSSEEALSGEVLTLKTNYKKPNQETSLMTYIAKNIDTVFQETTPDFKFASSVAAFGMLLRNSPYRGGANLNLVLQLARMGMGEDKDHRRQKFFELIEKLRRRGAER